MYSRLAEFDQVMVGSCWGQAPDVQVGFAELLPACRAAAAALIGAAVGSGARGSHGLRRRANGGLPKVTKPKHGQNEDTQEHMGVKGKHGP